jgi:hypothetical protein
MSGRLRFFSVAAVMVLAAVAAELGAVAAPTPSDIEPALRNALARSFRFTNEDLQDLQKGKIVKRGLDGRAPTEVAVVGATRVNASKDLFVERFRDIVHFKSGPEILQIGRFSNPPSLDDLAGLTIDRDDFDGRSCRLNDCPIRLPAATIRRFQQEINWSAPDADAHAAAMLKQVLVDDARAYLSGSPDRIVEYDDMPKPVKPVPEFRSMLRNTPAISELVPGLPAHLESFPSASLPGAEDLLYWSKEKFGVAPFISITHVTIVRPSPTMVVITTKDVYSSRYFDASLVITLASEASK